MTYSGTTPGSHIPPSTDVQGNPQAHGSPREILFFAIASEIAGTRSMTLSFDGEQTMGEVRARISSIFPALSSQLALCALAKDGVIAKDNEFLGPARAIAVLPPVSGG